MKHLKELDEYTIKFKRQELKDIWFFFNNHLNMNHEKEECSQFILAKKFCEEFNFVTKD